MEGMKLNLLGKQRGTVFQCALEYALFLH